MTSFPSEDGALITTRPRGTAILLLDDGRIGGLDTVDGGDAGCLGAGLAPAGNARYANTFVDAVAQIWQETALLF